MKSLPSLVGSNKQIRWALQLREKHIDLLKRSYEESCCNDELLWLIFFVAKLTDASSFINVRCQIVRFWVFILIYIGQKILISVF